VKTSGEIRAFHEAVAIVTGGASGIGRALGEALADRGCRVVLADLQINLAEEVAAGIRTRGSTAVATPVDVTDFHVVDRLVRETAGRWGRLDYIFNNAGIVIGGEARDHSIEDWQRIIDVNLRGVVNGTHAAYAAMLEQGFGHIVNTASVLGLIPAAFTVSYAATKHAVVGLSRSLHAEAAAAGIRVSVLCPGVIRTPLLLGGKYGRILQSVPETPIPEDEQRDYWERFRPMEPATFARRALRQVARNKPIIILPSWWKVAWWIHRASPSLGMLLAQKHVEATRRELREARERRQRPPHHTPPRMAETTAIARPETATGSASMTCRSSDLAPGSAQRGALRKRRPQ
jgi:NAD(P)-dependent dehydrogenase (short-subunit alcohol dehydrogenase family)